eukprot:185175_1
MCKSSISTLKMVFVALIFFSSASFQLLWRLGIQKKIVLMNDNETPFNTHNYTNIELSSDLQFCEYWNDMIFTSHHKTGTILLMNLARKIRKFWCIYCKPPNKECKPMRLKKGFDNIHWFHNPNVWKEQLLNHISTHLKSTIIVNIIRNPVDTLISAYNFHLKENGGSEWTNKLNNINYLSNTLKSHYVTKYCKNCESEFHLSYDKMIYIMTNECNKLNISNNTCTFQILLKNMDLNNALQLEYYKYLFWSGYGRFNDIFFSYQYIKTNQQNLSKFGIYMQNVRMEDFMQNFNKSCLKLLEFLKIKNEKQQIELLEMAQSENLKDMKKHMHSSTLKHVTSGTYNKSKQIHVLLSSYKRCINLKNFTLLLDYMWIYSDYC